MIEKPSQVRDVPWLYAKRKKRGYPGLTRRSGKWLIFGSPASIDDVWAKIKPATEQGRLGHSSKVATARPNRYGPNRRVICVYTYGWEDEEDVRRVLEELRKLGITDEISYKADEDTLSGKYWIDGHSRISKYYE